MNKSSTFGMSLHQGIAFSGIMSHMDKAPALFWPGCALMNLEPWILDRTAAILRRAEPGLGLSTCCCGQPSQYIFPDKFPSRQSKLRERLAASGVQRVYAACPNCTAQLRSLGQVEVIPIWQVLAECIRPEDVTGKGCGCVLHDPCPMRNEPAEMEAVRRLCAMAGAEVTEPQHTREHSICCGNFHMMHATDPQRSALMRQRRLGEFPEGLAVASCCEGCLSAFRGEGRDAVHVLELLFGRSQKRGWGNRFRFTRGAKGGK